MKSYNILVVDDEKEIADVVEIYLLNQGYKVFKANNGLEGLKIVDKEDIHLAIIDMMMPVMDGASMIMKLREKHNFPVIILSAKSEEVDQIMGLNIGADDYVNKPFKPLELLARVNSQLRRYTKYMNISDDEDGEKEDEGLYIIGGLELNENKRTVSVDDKPVKITPIEFKILNLLMKNPGRVFSSEEIYEKVWNEPFINSENTVAVHIRRIREKIEVDPKEPMYLKVVWGVGYKIDKI